MDEGHPAGRHLRWSRPRRSSAAFSIRSRLPGSGTVAVFSVACGAVAFRMRKVYGVVAAVVAVAALLTFPRLFSEAHFATLDGQLTAWWLMLWAADASLRSDARSTIGVGVLAGLTSAAKFTGWLAWLPLVVSRILRAIARQRSGLLLILPAGAAGVLSSSTRRSGITRSTG